METIKAFFADYGYSFLMMVVIGFVVAIITEITIKKAFNWLEKKVDGHEKTLAAVAAARTVGIQLVTWLQVIAFTKLLVANMPLPGGAVFYPIWLCLIYIIQYVFSMYGLKGILEAIRNRADREPKVKEPKKDPLEGLTKLNDKLYTDGQGNYFTAKGKKL